MICDVEEVNTNNIQSIIIKDGWAILLSSKLNKQDKLNFYFIFKKRWNVFYHLFTTLYTKHTDHYMHSKTSITLTTNSFSTQREIRIKVGNIKSGERESKMKMKLDGISQLLLLVLTLIIQCMPSPITHIGVNYYLSCYDTFLSDIYTSQSLRNIQRGYTAFPFENIYSVLLAR